LNNAGVSAFNLAIGDGNPASGYMPASGNMLEIANSSQGENNFLTTKIDSLNLPGPEIIKIDVEGFELKVLCGAEKTIETYMPKIIIETRSLELRRECHTFLEKRGYVLKHEGRTVTPKHSWMDEVTNLFYLANGNTQA
jgi:hypothetical protein